MNGADALLEVQGLDTETEQLIYRRVNIADRTALSGAEIELLQVETLIDTVTQKRVEVAARHKLLEDEAAIIEARAAADDNRLYSGEIQGLRDLQALQDEIVGLRSRQDKLEERVLEIMYETEKLDEQVSELQERRNAAVERVSELSAVVEAAEAEIDHRLHSVELERARAAGAVAPDLLARYERLRPVFASSTAVGFDPVRGCGCPSTMPAVEADRVRRAAPGSVLDCAECGRIVLRSG